MKHIIYIVTFLLTTLSVAQNNTLFEEGNALYNEGKFTEAIAKYEAVLNANKHSASLYYNLGNAHYKLNNIAPSIYYFEKALMLSPNDKEIQNNIAFARNMTVDAIDVVPEVGISKLFKNLTNTFSFNGWAYASVFAMVLFVLLSLWYYFSYSSNRKRFAFVGSSAFLFLAIITLFFAFKKYDIDKKYNPAIVFSQEAIVKSEPNLRSQESFRLHEGTKVLILDTVNNWKKIKLTDGKEGWIFNDAIKALNEI
ncbi:tetratricopeptide repeat protein [Lacinutrix sp. C3R15]|uniref:tetratricopeptide repeat protein n=1 Tax=Flavobacteriaceae TaxID=49546 RepID=UPI001C09346D|nr:MULTISPECIES: tetratricopeptide repeat protein [Flavobacteriaceae]MBU2940973.1 tetratricopeptide repeat protein [Lacinutrix sp. C3R15]MDO6624292.1 tetratricopeptide repeat protein [Oceanihabitans sp. 1_MG-2023]